MPTQTTKLAELLKAGRFALVGVAATLIHLGVAQAALATGGLSVFWAFGLVQAQILSEAVALAIAIAVVPVGTFLASRFWGFQSATPDH